MNGELNTVSEAAQYLKLSTKTVLCLISDKKIPASKVSDRLRLWRIKASDIDEYLKNNTNSKKKTLSGEDNYHDCSGCKKA